MRLPSLWWLPLGKVPEVSPDVFHAWLEGGRLVQVIDARTMLEFQQGTIGDAGHAPLTGMPGSMEYLSIDPHRPVVVLCLTGHRSRPGTRWLRVRGIEAYSLAGGVMAWKKAGYAVQPPKGKN
jgi:rhodanese-related sulfurtransferase